MDIISILLLLSEAAFGYFLLWKAGLLKSTRHYVVSALLLGLAFGLRGAAFPYETLDYQNFLHPWVEFFRTNGGFLALKTPVGNYNIPYLYFMALFSLLPLRDLYLIKLLSVFFDLILAWACMLLLGRFTRSVLLRLGLFFAVLFWPTVFLNSAVWGQCDGIYVALAVLGLYLALEDRPVLSMLCITLSFGFKLQAVFLMPIYAVLWMLGKFRWKHFLIFPAAYVALVLPAVLLGRPFLDTITLYFSQTGSIGSGLNYNSPSVFAIFWRIQESEPASTIAIVIAFVYLMNLLAVAWANREKLNDRGILALSVLFAIGIPFLLPHMHDRYFYGADVLTLVLAFALPAAAPAALLTEFASFLGYHAYLKMRFLLYMNYGAWALIGALIIAAVCFADSLHRPWQPPKGKGASSSPTRRPGSHASVRRKIRS